MILRKIRNDPAGPAFPAFRPHPLLRSGHAQTVAANYLHGTGRRLVGAAGVRATERRDVPLPDGDRVVLHDDRPADWQPGMPAALLLHGLGGCHRSGYLVRAAAKLTARGVRAFRLDYRGIGAGHALAARPYHAGQSDDVLAALRLIERLCPDSPLGLAGYSMGGNVALKTLGEDPGALPETLVRAAVVNPAIDLAVCCDSLTGPMQRLYDWHFARHLSRHVSRHAAFADSCRHLAATPATRIREFDERFTVPQWNFASVEDYYAAASSVGLIARISVPTLILHSKDDPLIPGRLFETLDRGPAVTLHVTEHGGHLGFIGVRGVDPDRRWMDWRVIDWLTGRIGPSDVPTTAPPGRWTLDIGRDPLVAARGVVGLGESPAAENRPVSAR